MCPLAPSAVKFLLFAPLARRGYAVVAPLARRGETNFLYMMVLNDSVATAIVSFICCMVIGADRNALSY